MIRITEKDAELLLRGNQADLLTSPMCSRSHECEQGSRGWMRRALRPKGKPVLLEMPDGFVFCAQDAVRLEHRKRSRFTFSARYHSIDGANPGKMMLWEVMQVMLMEGK